MKRILYNGGTVITGDAIAHAVLEYASELARHESSDTVDIPTVNAEGVGARAELLLGPASQFVVEPVGADQDDPTDDALVAEIESKTAKLLAPRPVASADSSGYPDFDEPTESPDPPLAEAG
jgi:hypothetical protein